MSLGLERGMVRLLTHDSRWDAAALEAIAQLKTILGNIAMDIQHVGSTSIQAIAAKPIIDIAVAVCDFEAVLGHIAQMERAGFLYRKQEYGAQLLFACGDYTIPNGIVTHFIHVVKHQGVEWKNYLRFRDYLNARLTVAKEYEALKLQLVAQNPIDPGREKYLAGKHDFIQHTLRKAQVWSYLGKTATITIDRPIGTAHPKHPDILYPINYGYIAGEFAPDNEELDVYILGVNKPLERFCGQIIAIVHRNNDVEDKLVAAPDGVRFTVDEITAATRFQEQFYDSTIEVM